MNLDNAMCISLWQPWAQAVALGLKRLETRSWSTSHRGPLLIHAAKLWTREQSEFHNRACGRLCLLDAPRREVAWFALTPPLGCVVAVAELVQCCRTNWMRINCIPALESLFGDFGPDRYAWELEDVVRLPRPVPCGGGQRLWRPSAEVLAAVRSQMTEEPC